MPTKKKTTTKKTDTKTKKTTMSMCDSKMHKKAMPVVNDVREEVVTPKAICPACNVLPIGHAEMLGVLIIVIFALTAVLFTSVYALNSQQEKIDALQQQLEVQI